MAVRRNEVALGGSSAQRKVIEDTLLDALLAAGRLAQARSLIERRLDRRPSRRDQRRLYQLTGSPSRGPHDRTGRGTPTPSGGGSGPTDQPRPS